MLRDADASARYAALITDCHMPNLDGYGLVERIRADEAVRQRVRLPILALTANAMQGERERCLAAGMDAYLAKPFQVDQLAAALAGLVAQEATAP